MHKSVLETYQLKRIADFRIKGNTFLIETTDFATVGLSGCIYAFVINGEIVRVGSSARPLKMRLSEWMRDVSKSLEGGRSPTPTDEAERWRRAVTHDSDCAIYARQGTCVTTTVGSFTAYLDEERIIIAQHRPRLNRSLK